MLFLHMLTILFKVSHLYRLMVSTLINECLISRTCGLPFKTEKKLEQKLGFNLVTDNYLMNDLIAGSFG